ncbi:hypothetical protein PRIPAC_75336 [Pristionchus pacificus]|uniref:Uncharacterized protein n=1 Tax=Pristionchus pacificus TaxID=54126 RepID=A0A2A6C0G2_PRIPA|nr:hypothetical protein PRIPAC_75336 [Pristionchus pacificus]|eukprot:PDM71630.1 hypothetical protein PRIPAC_38037 [Pristionchus pacificus]
MSKRPVGDRFYHDGFILKKKAVLKDDRILLHCTYRESYGCRALTSEVIELRRELAVDAVAQPTAAPRDLVNNIRNKATSGAVVSMLDKFMPFLPSADVPNAFVEIKQAAPPGMTAFLEYVSKNYVNGPPNGTGPRYPIDEWTVTARLGAARTNCSAEAFNSVFSKKVGASGAKLGSRLIDLLIDEESRIATALPAFYQNPQFRIGPAECSHTRKRNEIIQRATLNVNNLTGIRYLDHLSTRIGKFRK